VSRDLYLRCKQHITADQIETVILPLGWVRTEDLCYSWFHTEHHESTRGCWLYVTYDPEDQPRGTKTLFHAYSNAGRSHEDLEAQNGVLRALRKDLGGSLLNPEDGRRTYLLNDVPKLTPSEKACGFTYVVFDQHLGRVSMLIVIRQCGHTNSWESSQKVVSTDGRIQRPEVRSGVH